MRKRVVVTGAAGLVGQNLIMRLKKQGITDIVAIDKHPTNTEILQRLHPDILVLQADLADPTSAKWVDELAGCDALVVAHAQIGGTRPEEFVRNNQEATRAPSGSCRASQSWFCCQHILIGCELGGCR